jgi:aspartyl-tRNA(Asn)/glutamyl-tRNA(Gln) amidotransferase subunit A
VFDRDLPDLIHARNALTAGRTTARDIVERAIHRIETWDGALRTFVYTDFDGARRAAAHPTGPLAGLPLGIKDLADVRDMPTTGGSKAYHWVAPDDAPVVHRLREAGAAIIGKTNTQELAFGVFTPPTRNPWNPDHIPGGSSGGSAAALAAGMILGALGTDTGGSVRIPAACCGVVGFKPTYGRIPAEGIMPLSYTCDHVGPLAHSVRDAALLYRIMAGLSPDPAPTVPTPTPGHRAAIPWSYLDKRLTDPMRAAFESAVRHFVDDGWTLVDIPMEPWAEWLDLQLTVRLPEAYLYHREVLEGPRRALLGEGLAERLDPGKTLPATQYVAAQLRRKALQQEWAARAAAFDVILMPTVPATAPRVGETELRLPLGPTTVWEAFISLTAPWNVLGWPAISVPMGVADDGLPTGLQIIGPWGADEQVLDVAARYEATVGLLTPPTPSPA